jgi:hypothetical protein
VWRPGLSFTLMRSREPAGVLVELAHAARRMCVHDFGRTARHGLSPSAVVLLRRMAPLRPLPPWSAHGAARSLSGGGHWTCQRTVAPRGRTMLRGRSVDASSWAGGERSGRGGAEPPDVPTSMLRLEQRQAQWSIGERRTRTGGVSGFGWLGGLSCGRQRH